MIKKPVPVFMYHSIGVPNKNWKWNYLTTPYEDFEKELIYLKKHGFSTIHLADLDHYINSNQKIPDKSVVLTFDDGYVDNYIFAYPLLKKYGFKGTIFVNPDFVDPRGLVRERIDENNEVINQNTTGFLSWEEMKIMESDGTIDIQSHALTHTWYPISDKIIDYRHLGDLYWWMTWNDFPDKKPFLQLDKDELIKLGAPVYENEKSLMSTRYFPNEELSNYLTSYVTKNGGLEFFKNSNWKEILDTEKNKFIETTNSEEGYFETEDERLERIKFELAQSKKIIEENLDKEIHYLCWPGGSGTTEGHSISRELGYRMTTAARDIPASKRKMIKNDGLIYPDRIGRTSPVLHNYVQSGLQNTIYSRGFGMGLKIKAFCSHSYKRKFFAASVLILGRLNFLFKSKL